MTALRLTTSNVSSAASRSRSAVSARAATAHSLLGSADNWSIATCLKSDPAKCSRRFLPPSRVDELDAVGPEYQHRRAAAVAGLAIADKVVAFAACKDRAGKTLDVDIGHLIALDKSDRYIKRILPRWVPVAALLGGDEAALARLAFTPETTLPVLDPGTPNAKHIFDLLEAKQDARVEGQRSLLLKRTLAVDPPRRRSCSISPRITGPSGANRRSAASRASSVDEHADEVINSSVGQSLYIKIHLRPGQCQNWLTEYMDLVLSKRECLERKVVAELLLLPPRRPSQAERV